MHALDVLPAKHADLVKLVKLEHFGKAVKPGEEDARDAVTAGPSLASFSSFPISQLPLPFRGSNVE